MTESQESTAFRRYSIVVPCFNEQDSIVPLLEEIVAITADDPAYEVIIVDDCSNDETMMRLLEAKNSFAPNLKLVAHSVNCGQSAAICTGVDVARGTWIATLDGDGQNDPADIPKLVAVLNDFYATQSAPTPAPIICGHRTKRHDSRLKLLSSRVANAVRSALLKDATADTGCGLKLMQREAFLRLPRFDHMHRFLPALMQREGAQVISVAVGHRARQAGQSKYGVHNRLWVGIIDLIGVIWLRRRKFNSANYKEL